MPPSVFLFVCFFLFVLFGCIVKCPIRKSMKRSKRKNKTKPQILFYSFYSCNNNNNNNDNSNGPQTWKMALHTYKRSFAKMEQQKKKVVFQYDWLELN